MAKPAAIRFGLPKGRYNHEGRFNTKLFLEAAGFKFGGYEPGKEEEYPECVSDPEIVPVLMRQEDGPDLLVSGIRGVEQEVHLAILGEDWRREWELSRAMRRFYGKKFAIPHLSGLNYARNKVVAAVSEDDLFALEMLQEKSLSGLFQQCYLTQTPFVCVTKYVNLASHVIADALLKERNRYFLAVGKPLDKSTVEGAVEKFVSVQGRSFKPARIYPLAYVIERYGETEGAVARGLANVVIENVGTGRTMRAHKLRILSILLDDCSAVLYGHITRGWESRIDLPRWASAYEAEKRGLVDTAELVRETRAFIDWRYEKLNYIIGRIRLAVEEMAGVSYCVFDAPGLEAIVGNFVSEQRCKETGLLGSGKPIAAFAQIPTSLHQRSMVNGSHVMVYGDAARQELERLVRKASPAADFYSLPLSKVAEMSSLWGGWNADSRYPFFSHLFFKEDVAV